MRINVVFIPVANAALGRDDRTQIERTIRKHALRAAKLLRLREKIITFSVHPHWWEWGGSAESKEWIRLRMPLRWKSQQHCSGYLEKRLPSAVYHEMHHLARRDVFSPEKTYPPHTLINSLVSEGLATVFEQEQLPGYQPKYGRYQRRVIHTWLPAVRREKWSRNYDYLAWFHGKGKPRWLGYKIGTYIIDHVKARHPRRTARTLARESVRNILKLSGVKL